MPHHREDNRLSTGDALFLYLEREGMPLNVASVSVFEGEISLRACSRFIETKLPQIPRYRQRVTAPAYGLGQPSWEFDPEFDIRNHVGEVTLKEGTEKELKAAAGAILSKMMDRRRPLWDFTLIHGLHGNCTGVVTRMHHCLADGLAGVSLMTALMDTGPEVPILPRSKARFHVRPKTEAPALVDELITSSVAVAEKVLSAQVELFQVVQQVLGSTGGEAHMAAQPTNHVVAYPPSMAEFTRLVPELTSATQPLPFNIICRGPQKFDWTEIPLADIKAVKQAYGVTVNEVALTLITLALQKYAELRGVRLKGRLLRIVVPVSVRGDGKASDLGNRITFIPVVIPLDIPNPRRLVAAIRKRTAFLKSAHVAECVGLFGTMLGTIPTMAQQIVGPIVSQVPLGLCNLIFTNVPGPATPLYLLGHKMLRCYPYVPIGGDMGINCAMLTYNGIAYFGFTGDIHAAPDLGRLQKFLAASFVELRKAAGLGPKRRQRWPRKAETTPVVILTRKTTPKPAQAVIPVPTSAQTPIVTEPVKSELLTRISA